MASRDANEAMAAKLRKIRELQARGWRVLILQNNRVQVWRKATPEQVKEYWDLDTAFRWAK